MPDHAVFMTDLHRQHVAAKLSNLEATQEALRLAIICAAFELDPPTGLDVEDLGKGLVLSGTPMRSCKASSSHKREFLSDFLETGIYVQEE